jgi:hypothetical protein
MGNSGNGHPPKKETVYSGPATAAFGAQTSGSAATATAERETIYSGPDPGETVFDETKFIPKQPNRSVGIAATRDKVQRMSVLFFVVSGISLIEYLTYRGHDTAVAVNSIGVFVIFLIIGIFAFRLSRTAFVVAMGLYALDTAVLLWWVFGSGGSLLFVAWLSSFTASFCTGSTLPTEFSPTCTPATN